MKKFFRFLFVALFFGGWVLAALSLHIVRGEKTVTVIPKNRIHWSKTYVDTRAWTAKEVYDNRDIVKRMLDTDHAAELSHTVSSTTGEPVEELLIRAIMAPPPDPKSAAKAVVDTRKIEIPNDPAPEPKLFK